MASEQCIRTLEHCAVADETASHFLKHVKPLHIALSQMHMVSRTTAPRDVVPIANLISEYLDAPRANIPVGDDLPQMQRTIVSIVQTLLQSPVEATRFQMQNGDGMGEMEDRGGVHSAEESLKHYFWDDSLGQGVYKSEY
jgi:hypothetical protein